jgi:cob(I)alamin adenosyltransferase
MVLSFLQQVPEQTEVVLTGRNPPASLLEKADYISEIRNIRHPYEKHIKARKGIEF